MNKLLIFLNSVEAVSIELLKESNAGWRRTILTISFGRKEFSININHPGGKNESQKIRFF